MDATMSQWASVIQAGGVVAFATLTLWLLSKFLGVLVTLSTHAKEILERQAPMAKDIADLKETQVSVVRILERQDSIQGHVVKVLERQDEMRQEITSIAAYIRAKEDREPVRAAPPHPQPPRAA